jgi:hypothetical protein
MCITFLLWGRRGRDSMVCKTDLQLPIQSVHITSKVVGSIPTQAGVLDITLCDTICQ